MLALLVANALFALAQTPVRGTVVDAETGRVLAGATVVAGGQTKTTTDANGNFYVNCTEDLRIMASFVGYETNLLVVKKCSNDLVIALTPSNTTLSNVEITSTATQNKSILYQPSSITKLNNTELKRGTGLFLDDAINANVPGVIMQRRAVSSGQQFNIRGYGNGVNGTRGISNNFDIQGTKVYLNGIPITDAEGITMLDDIDFSTIGSVEVVKGPAGALYGLAIAGVVNLKTIRPESGKTAVGQEVLMGNYGLQRYTTRFEMGGERSSLLASYGYQKSDGAMAHNASTKHFANLVGEVQINGRQSINTYFGYTNSYDERGGELTLQQWADKDYSGNPRYIQKNAHSGVISFRGGVAHSYQISNVIANTTSIFGSGASTNASSAANWTDKNPLNFGLRSTFNTNFALAQGIALSGITGVETQKQYAQAISYNMVPNPNDPTGYYVIEAVRSNQATTTGTTSFFTEWSLALPRAFSITAGVGYSNMNIELNDRVYAPNKRTHYDTSYKNMVAPHLAINKVFGEKVSVYASYSKGYKAPVSSLFYIPYTGQLNSGLKPEMGDQLEVGTKGSLLNNRLSYQVAAFNTIFANKMAAVAVAQGGTTLYSYVVNSGKQNNKGIEAQVKYIAYRSAAAFFSLIRPFANITYSNFKYKDYVFLNKNYNGLKVAGVPPITFNAGFDANTSVGLYANATYLYRDEVFITSDNLNKTESFGLLNAKLGLRRSLSGHFDVDAYFGINNITGTQYYNMIFVNQFPNDVYLPAPLKPVYFGGLHLKYNF